MRPGYRWIHTGSFSSVRCALGVVGFIRVRLVPSGALWGSLDSCGSFGSSKVVWFIREHPGGVEFMRVFGIVRGRWVHSSAPWGSLGSSGVVGLTRVRHVGRWVHAASLGSSGVALRYALVFVGFIRCRWVLSGAPWGSLRSSVIVGFTRVRLGGHCVHPGSLGSLRFALVIVGFIQGRLVHSGAPWTSLG